MRLMHSFHLQKFKMMNEPIALFNLDGRIIAWDNRGGDEDPNLFFGMDFELQFYF